MHEWFSDGAILEDFRAWRNKKGHSDHLLTLYTVAHYCNDMVAVEIGVRDARSTRVLLSVIERIGGHLYSCDINPKCVNNVPDACKENWSFFPMPSAEFALSWSKPIDLLFIDGDHSYDAAKSDFDLLSQYIAPGGFLLMHDAKVAEHSGVSRVIKDIDPSRWMGGLFPVGAGTAIFQKKGAR